MATKKPSGKTTAAPRKRTSKKRAQEVTEEAQNMGADVVPEGTIEVTVSGTPTTDNRQPTTGSLLSDWDLHLFNEGTHRKLWEKLGAHIVPGGVVFGVWAPNAERVSVVGDFNGWDSQRNPLEARG